MMSDTTPPNYSGLNSAAQRAECSLYLTGFVKPGSDALKYPRHGLGVNITPRMASGKSSTRSGIPPSQARDVLLAVTRTLFCLPRIGAVRHMCSTACCSVGACRRCQRQVHHLLRDATVTVGATEGATVPECSTHSCTFCSHVARCVL